LILDIDPVADENEAGGQRPPACRSGMSRHIAAMAQPEAVNDRTIQFLQSRPV